MQINTCCKIFLILFFTSYILIPDVKTFSKMSFFSSDNWTFNAPYSFHGSYWALKHQVKDGTYEPSKGGRGNCRKGKVEKKGV